MAVEYGKVATFVTPPDMVGEHLGGTERRERILEASWKVLSQVGFEKITTRRIAEAAGINIATLHYHFGSKEAVLIETLRYAQRSITVQMRAALAGATTAREMMERAFVASLQMTLARPGVLRFDLAVRGFRDADARREAMSLYKVYQGVIQAILERHIEEGGTFAPGVTAESLGQYLVAVVDGIVLHHTLFGDDVALEKSLNLVQDHTWQLMNLSP